jgi:polyferredoxin
MSTTEARVTNIPLLLPEPENGNLLSNRWIGGLMRSRWYPGIFQWPTLIVFAFIMLQLLLGPQAAHDNFGTALTWVLWWPLIPIMFLGLGRFWCTICPFGTVNDLVQKFAGNNQPVPKFLKKYGIWIIDALFILITWTDHAFGIVESPRGSGYLLLLLTTSVVFSGAFWQRRTFCRYVCFLGGLAGNYARTGMLALRGTPATCQTCTAAACYKGGPAAPGCPMFEFPKTMTSNASCNLCANCLKNCPNGSIQLTLRAPTKELWFIQKPKVEEAFLAAVIMGIVFVQNVTMLQVWQSALAWFETVTGIQNYLVTFSLTFVVAMAIPVGLVALAAWVTKKLNGASVAQNFARFGYALIALDVAAHMAHNLFHLLAEGKGVIFTAVALFGQQTHGASPALLGTGTIQALQFGLIGLGLAGSLYTAYRIARHAGGARQPRITFLPFAALMTLLAVVNIGLFMLPMAMRM